MARIVSYQYDYNIQDDDAWIGTDALSLSTRQFTAAALAGYLNIRGKVSISGQMSYKYISSERNGTGTFSLPGGGVQNIPFSSITSLVISEIDAAEQNVAAFLSYLVGSDILISSQEAMGQFGHYKVVSYTPDAINASYYNLVLDYIGGNGSMQLDKTFNIIDFILASAADSDKHFSFTQNNPSLVWTINHNLNKYGSATVTNFNDIVIYGEIDYTSVNQIVITFTTPLAGRAFIN